MSAASFDTLGTARDLGSADFPGCESFHLPASEIDRYECRLEFWDGDTETGWKVCEPTSIQHEAPCQELAQMAGRFAMLRGSRIACFGSADLVRLDATGRKRWLMQADQVLYLHPGPGAVAGDRPSTWTPTRCRMWCWRWTTPRTCGGGSWTSTRRAGFRRFGCWCHGRHRCARRG